jgi:PAS domain S-box-containing protein
VATGLVILARVSRSRRSPRDDIAGALRYHSEERFRLLVESVKDYAIFMLDCDGLVTSWNAGAERITGYGAGEAVGAHFSRFYAEEARETHWPEHELSVAANDGRAEDEGWRIGKGGERFWAHTVITALRDNAGTLRGYASIFRDLSDRRRQEEQLAQNEERLRALLSSVRDYAIVMLDPGGIVVSWSEGAELTYGYRAEEIIGAHFSRFVTPEAVERGWPAHELQVAATEGRFEDEDWRVRKDGSRFWANVVLTALRDRNSRLLGFCKIGRDLSERRRQEEALRQSEERFRLLIESVQEYAIFMLDAGGRVLSWNAGAQNITGFPAAQIIGRHFSSFYLPEDIHSGVPWQQLEAARLNGRLEVEGLRTRNDGTAFCAHVLIAPVYDSEGRLRGYSHITHDLTRLRHMRALEDSGRRMNEFLAVLSHELRNPLAPMRHAAALMQHRPLAESTLERASAIIDHQVGHLARVVDDLLDVARVVQGKIVIVRERIEISTVTERALEIVMPLMQQRGQTLHAAPFDAALAVQGDLVRLTQVLSNLLDNASRYTPPGGDIWLDVRRIGGEIELSVRDSGRGISAERLSAVFDFFSAADAAAADSDGGLGVGLGLTRRLVELHGGRAIARSAGVGLGAQFIVMLPLAAALPAADAGNHPPAPAGQPPGAGRQPATPADASATQALPGKGPRRVLVVDDNVDSATSLMMLLQVMGHEAQCAHDGVEALEAAERFAPDTVLLDIGLPRLNGYEVARRLRDEGGHHYLLVALTGWGQEEDRARAHAAGFDYHLVKPVDLDQLGRILATGTTGTAGTEPAPGTAARGSPG